MTTPRFSVITIALNDLPGFIKTKASIDTQTFRGFEWIVVDGGSTDGTVEQLRGLDRPNYVWTSERDSGLFDAMNKGLRRATGQYILFVNSGDRLAGSATLASIDAALPAGAPDLHLLFGDAYEETSDGRLLLKKARSVRAIKYGMFTHHQAMVYPARAIVGMSYDLSFSVAADYDFTCRLLRDGGRTVQVDFPISINARAGWSEKHAHIGRRENLAIQRRILRLGRIRRIWNHALFLSSSVMRTHTRGLYDRIRFRQSPPMHAAR